MLEAYLKSRQISTGRHCAPSQKAVILNLDRVPQVEGILCTRLQGVLSQKTFIFILYAVRVLFLTILSMSAYIYFFTIVTTVSTGWGILHDDVTT
jgi:hypothetical protein